jgi:hypothetical protein
VLAADAPPPGFPTKVFNEFNARELFNHWNVFRRIEKNTVFLWVLFVTVALQILIVEFGDMFVKCSPLPIELWGWSVLFGFVSMPWGLFLRLALPLNEDPATFFGYDMPMHELPIPEHLVGRVQTANSGGMASTTGDAHV